ncbi:hypothetical protein K0M31_017587 [Melipona bicolor]|uniref:Uncharacterized protein n=1 Tax=Melipona bicolor TaxID=60889 RepID=A0AA40G554_9HYME|nr:hypothetical protein K0M31_017587 [Melipona bicolor]
MLVTGEHENTAKREEPTVADKNAGNRECARAADDPALANEEKREVGQKSFSGRRGQRRAYAAPHVFPVQKEMGEGLPG